MDEASRLRAAIGRISRRLRPTDAAAGLTPTQISVLHTIEHLGSVRPSALAEAEGMNPTMLSRVLATLVERGFVRRVSDPADRRAALVEATAAGRQLRQRMHRERSAKLVPTLSALPARERKALLAALPALESLADLLPRSNP